MRLAFAAPEWDRFGFGRRLQQTQEGLRVAGECAMARVDHIEVSSQHFRIGNFDRRKFSRSQFIDDCNLGKKTQAELALHHAFGGFDGFDFEDSVRQLADAAKQALGEGPVARSAIEEDQGHAFDVFEPDVAALRGGMFGMPHEDEGIVTKSNGFDFRVIQRARDANFGFRVEDHFQHLGGGSGTQAHHNLGICSVVVFHHVGKKISADGERGSDAERAAGRRLDFVDGLAGAGDFTKDAFGVGAESFSRGGDGKRAAVAREEAHAQGFFQGADAGADGRLTDAEGFCGPVKAAVGADREEGLNLVDFHDSPGLQSAKTI